MQPLDEYFLGERKIFDFPIYQEGTDFQQKIWKELIQIPCGKTITYLQLAQPIGNVKAIRAATAPNGRNLLWITVSCHRVIGSNGSLTGYAGGLPMKKWLLEHENKYANGVSLLF
jgi:methylated-DNA-[protein]-cysteine S-methyltransferase